MCNRARLDGAPETIHTRFDVNWAQDVVRPNRDPVDLVPKGQADVIRTERERSAFAVMT